MIRVTCCKDCTERHIACHDTCKKYLEEKENTTKKQMLIYENRHKEQAKIDEMYRSIQRHCGRKRK